MLLILIILIVAFTINLNITSLPSRIILFTNIALLIIIASYITVAYPSLLIFLFSFGFMLSFYMFLNIYVGVDLLPASIHLSKFLRLLDRKGVLYFLDKIYNFVFNYLSNGWFRVITIICNLGVVVYACLSKYLFCMSLEHTTFLTSTQFLFYITSFICLILIYFRFFVNLSLLLLPAADRLLMEPVNDIDSPSSPTTPSSSSKNYSLFSRHSHQHNHHYPGLPKFNSWQKTGIIAAVCAAGAACYAGYYVQQQAIAAQQQAIAAQQHADQWEVDRGIMSKAEYKTKWKK